MGKISDIETNPLVHKTIKKSAEDIVDFRFNTCVSDMMILTNEIDTISKEDYLNILKILCAILHHDRRIVA